MMNELLVIGAKRSLWIGFLHHTVVARGCYCGLTVQIAVAEGRYIVLESGMIWGSRALLT